MAYIIICEKTAKKKYSVDMYPVFQCKCDTHAYIDIW